MAETPEEDLLTLVRQFRTSVSDDLTATHRQMDALRDEVRIRIETSETAILNSIRDLGQGLDRRMTGLELTGASTDIRLGRVEDRLTGVEVRLTGVEGRLVGVEDRLTGVEGRLPGFGDTGSGDTA
ncbi:hypothetical protein BH23ACT9_BH23ACT9_32050 [soil metagenome]